LIAPLPNVREEAYSPKYLEKLKLIFVFAWNFLLDAEDALLQASLALVSLALAPAIPVATGIAVMRHRLYDIDVIINRTLVYGTLTAKLALVYVGGVAAIQAIFRTLTGQEEQPSTCHRGLYPRYSRAVHPLRRRIQSFIDRRFYRSKYDARKTLEAFSAKLRDETDLDTSSDDLTSVVRETMQPAHVSLWLRPDPSPRAGQEPK
jgi:hypothetical protein